MQSDGYGEISTQDVDSVGEIWGDVGTLHDKSVDHFLLWWVVGIWIVLRMLQNKVPKKVVDVPSSRQGTSRDVCFGSIATATPAKGNKP